MSKQNQNDPQKMEKQSKQDAGNKETKYLKLAVVVRPIVRSVVNRAVGDNHQDLKSSDWGDSKRSTQMAVYLGGHGRSYASEWWSSITEGIDERCEGQR
jgi:ribose 1,5-bisphosphokinase PhnN